MTRHTQPAPDYTAAALVMGFVNLLWIFTAIWALWGLAPVILLAAALNAGISRLAT